MYLNIPLRPFKQRDSIRDLLPGNICILLQGLLPFRGELADVQRTITCHCVVVVGITRV